MCSLFEVLMCSLFEVLMCSSFEVLMCSSFEVLTCSLFHSGRKNFLYFFINYQDAVFSVLRSPTSRLVWPNTTLTASYLERPERLTSPFFFTAMATNL